MCDAAALGLNSEVQHGLDANVATALCGGGGGGRGLRGRLWRCLARRRQAHLGSPSA